MEIARELLHRPKLHRQSVRSPRAASGVLAAIEQPISVRRETPAAPQKNLFDLVAAVHEAAHAAFAYFNELSIHSVRIEGEGCGGGRIQAI
jgi:hypothetical protein